MPTFLQAAETILREQGRPLSAKEICSKALTQRLISTEGKTPFATVSAQIYVDMSKFGTDSKFVKAGKGKFGLASWNKLNDSSVAVAAEKSEGPPGSGGKSASTTFKDAAIRVLDEIKKPLDSKTITENALRRGYLDTGGKTPSATMSAQIYTDIKNRGNDSKFIQLGKNLFGLRKWDLEVLKPMIENSEQRAHSLETIDRPMRKRSIVGDPINFGGLMYGPLNENGVIFLFSKLQDKLPQPITIEAIQPAFPDAKGRKRTEKGWIDVWIEFEYLSSHFKQHKHDPHDCDIIVCWEDDWKNCPLEVIELKKVLNELGHTKL